MREVLVLAPFRHILRPIASMVPHVALLSSPGKAATSRFVVLPDVILTRFKGNSERNCWSTVPELLRCTVLEQRFYCSESLAIAASPFLRRCRSPQNILR
jgi:hypothetical protein